MNRSRSKGRLIETAFISKTNSSTEDLDEVDRLANHPVLRTQTNNERWRLRKSRSEMGGSLGFSAWPMDKSVSNQSSPICNPPKQSFTPEFGFRTVAMQKAREAQSKMKRSRTINFQQFYSATNASSSCESSIHSVAPPSGGLRRSAAFTALKNCDSKSKLPPSPTSSQWTEGAFETACNAIPSHTEIPSSFTIPAESSSNNNLENPTVSHNCLITSAVVEHNDNSCASDLISNLSSPPPLKATMATTPPNTAPLPAKFGIKRALPHNLLMHNAVTKTSLTDATTTTDSNSSASNINIISSNSQRDGDDEVGDEIIRVITEDAPVEAKDLVSPPPPKFRLPLSLVQRLKSEKKPQSSNSSSAESTPQKRHYLPPSRMLIHQTKLRLQQAAAAAAGRSQSPIKHSDPTEDVKPPAAPKPRRAISKKMALRIKSSAKNKEKETKFFNFSGEESESCSSNMSSLESVRSSTSDGVQSMVSTESGAGCSMSSQSSCAEKPNLLGDLKSSNHPHHHIRPLLSSSKFQVLSPISDKSQEQSEQGTIGRTPKVSPTDHILSACCAGRSSAIDDPDKQTLDNNSQLDNGNDGNGNTLPEFPKVSKRLRQGTHHEIKGSDSGISMTSQDVQDMYDLLQQQLPFDMPKLRRKTQQMLSSSNSACSTRPNSMPMFQPQREISGFPSKQTNVVFHEQNLNQGSTIEAPVNIASIAPPPVAFQDNDFYLTETQPLSTSANATQSSSGTFPLISREHFL